MIIEGLNITVKMMFLIRVKEYVLLYLCYRDDSSDEFWRYPGFPGTWDVVLKQRPQLERVQLEAGSTDVCDVLSTTLRGLKQMCRLVSNKKIMLY